MEVGYGICGHKNSFSTGVKIGNYVEDRIGAELARNSSVKPINKHSEHSASFINPRDMPDKCAHAPAENLVERNMLRQGLSYDLIFEHGRAHIPSTAEQKANNEAERRRQLDIKRAREARDQRTTYLSTSQAIIPTQAGYRRCHY
ncbi:hypothetical protein PHYSODRAFT_500582 [Phytophthora sojae]|uniref:Uncharacterized protein n=1 Tax=Phytophthora sojae (strain P6497) TaxID=1094619 RepID=G4ZI13_PHYSP|nr:hypothetical protein PHYSODRAFT_500582 [Phytophthora sojae]EGZ17656.1 hypothetical protein PHYSODRAFT_500582 [Phytophthora sojae]|eukprot:XP_009526714.1 hypothetical protein PHYSODRAFT_500582 [Phytophthora sojae]